MKFCLIVLFLWISYVIQVDTKPCSVNCHHKHSDQEGADHESLLANTNDTSLATHISHVVVRGKRSDHKNVSAPEINSTSKSNTTKTKKTNNAKKNEKLNETTNETANKKTLHKKNSNETNTLSKKSTNVDKFQKNGTQTKPTEESTISRKKKFSSNETIKNSDISHSDNSIDLIVNYTVTQSDIKNLDEKQNSVASDAEVLKSKDETKGNSEIKSTLMNNKDKLIHTTNAKTINKASTKNSLSSTDKKQTLVESLESDTKKGDENSIDNNKGGKNLHSPKKNKTSSTKSIPKNSTIVATKQNKAKLDKTMSVFKQKQLKTKARSTPLNDKATKGDKVSTKIKKNPIVNNRTNVKRSKAYYDE